MELIIDIKIIILLFFLILSGKSKVYFMLFAFTAIHEFGHILCGLLCGLKPAKIRIMPLGLSVTFQKKRIVMLKKILICLAGPLTNFFIAGILIFMNRINYQEPIIYANILIGSFNLLPIIPLDGGRIVKIWVDNKYQPRDAYKYIKAISNTTLIFFSCIVIITAFIVKNFFLLISIFMMYILTKKECKKVRLEYEVKAFIGRENIDKIITKWDN